MPHAASGAGHVCHYRLLRCFLTVCHHAACCIIESYCCTMCSWQSRTCQPSWPASSACRFRAFLNTILSADAASRPCLLPLWLFHVQLVEPHLSAKLASLTGLPLPGLVRAGTEQLLRTSQLEGQLLEQLFGTAAAVGSAARQGSGQQQQPGEGVLWCCLSQCKLGGS